MRSKFLCVKSLLISNEKYNNAFFAFSDTQLSLDRIVPIQFLYHHMHQIHVTVLEFIRCHLMIIKKANYFLVHRYYRFKKL